MWQRIRCWFGLHDFRGANIYLTGGDRQCFACGQKQRLILVDLGRGKVWMNVKSE